MKEKHKVCAACGKKFLGDPRVKYCGDSCRRAVLNEKKKLRRKEQPKRPAAGAWKITAIVAAAKRAGVQYGRFVQDLTPEREAEIYREYEQEQKRRGRRAG